MANSDTPSEPTGASTDELIAVPRQSFEALLARMDQMERALAVADRPARADTSTEAGTAPAKKVGRRAALVGLAGAAAAGTAVALGPASPAAAANGDPLVLGTSVNQASGSTGLAVSGSNRTWGIGVTDNGLGSFSGYTAVLGHAKNQAFNTGVTGYAQAGTGVSGQTDNGVGGAFFAAGANSIAIVATGQNTGITTGASVNPLQIIPRAAGPSNAAVSGTLYTHSEAVGSSTLWYRNQSNTTDPSGWRKLAGPDTAGAFHVLPVPVRIYDSRPGTMPGQGPKTQLDSGIRTLSVTHNGTGIPAGTTAVVVTVLLVNAASGAGNMTVWAGNQSRPPANTLVWGGSAGRFTTQTVTAVSPALTIRVSASLPTHVVLDVVGYYR